VARCCPAMPVAGVGEVLRARGCLEKFGAGATINRGPKVYTSCIQQQERAKYIQVVWLIKLNHSFSEIYDFNMSYRHTFI